MLRNGIVRSVLNVCALIVIILFAAIIKHLDLIEFILHRVDTGYEGIIENNKIKVLITGYGHSGITFIQQFIGQVLFDHTDTFYLFEPMHWRSFHYLAHSYHNDNASEKDYNYNSLYCQILSDFFSCKFKESIDYGKLFHRKRIVEINSNLQILNSTMLRNKCKSSKYLIFKDIHFHDFVQYQLLYDNHPNLKIISMIRNPTNHIPSALGMSAAMCVVKFSKRTQCNQSIENFVYQICDNQLYQIQYATSKWSEFEFNVFKLEDLVANLTNKFNQTIKYLYHIWKEKIKNNLINITRINMKYYVMKKHQWNFDKHPPTKPIDKYKITYITNYCKMFAEYNGYMNKTLLFMHIPKTGGTSIEKSGKMHNVLWGHFLFVHFNSLFATDITYLCKSMNMNCPFATWHIPLSYWLSYLSSHNKLYSNISMYFDIGNKIDYFCVIRHPFSKMVSEYKYLTTQGQGYTNIINIIKTKKTNDYCNEHALNVWIQTYLLKYKKMINKNGYCFGGCHFVKQYDFVYDMFGNKVCKNIVHFENFDEEITLLFHKYNLEHIGYTLSHLHDTVGANCVNSSLSVNNLTNMTKSIIYDMYKQDFIVFGYDFDNY